MKKTEFISALLDSEKVDNRVKKSIMQFVETVQGVDTMQLFTMAQEIQDELPKGDEEVDIMDPKVHINGIMLTIVQDELKERSGQA